MDWSRIKYFRQFEFDDPTAPGSGANMDQAFVEHLDELRASIGHPLTIHSGYRTPEHNATVGGVDSSAHTSGHAADIGALSSGERFEIVSAAIKAGFRRIGIGSTFVHLDDDLTKEQSVCWLYPPTEKRT